MGRVLAIGDIHGHGAALQVLLRLVGMAGGDTVVTLGDYVNRGPDSRMVLEELLALRERTNLIPLLGNHEIMTLLARAGKGSFNDWLKCGGKETLRSYEITSLKDFPESHWEFLKSCQRYHETEREIFVHANLDPMRPLNEQEDGALFWQHLEEAPRHLSGKVMICGHTPQHDGRPANLGSAVCIDTDVNRTGWLTCLEPATGRYWQANDEGGTREAVLKGMR